MKQHLDLEVVLTGESWRENTPVLQEALTRCSEAGGGTVRVLTSSEGAEIGTIHMPSYTELQIPTTSRLLAALEREAYKDSRYEALIDSFETEYFCISGGGVIDGRSEQFMLSDKTYIYEPKQFRPRMFVPIGCSDIRIEDVTFKDGPYWTVHPIGCNRITISNVIIDNNLRVPNCDGIDPDRCSDVRIIGCSIRCADDCIVLKTTKEFPQYGSCKSIIVSGCTLVSTSAAIKIGTESVADFEDIVISDCIINSSSRAIALQLRDQGNISHVSITNCIIETRLFEDHWWGRAEPIYITAVRRYSIEKETLPQWNPEGAVGTISDVRIQGIDARGENGVVIHGIKGSDNRSNVRNIRISDMNLRVEKTTKWKAGKLDLRPCDALGPAFRNPEEDPGLQDQPHAALYVHGTDSVLFKDVRITWKIPQDTEGYAQALQFSANRNLQCKDLTIEEQEYV